MATITIRKFPDNVLKILKSRAKANKRTLNNEILFCIEEIVTSRKTDPQVYLEQVRQLRNSLGFVTDAETIAKSKASGRI